MRIRYVRRVTRDDVGSRVSLRHWITDETRGPVPTDLVGRLIEWSDDDVLAVITRDHTVHEIPHTDVMSSRTVPEHPKLPPEPHQRPS